LETARINGGFWPGMSQPGQILTFQLNDQKGVKFPRVDTILGEVFEFDVPACRLGDGLAASRDVEFAWRVMLVIRELLFAVNVPAFDPGVIIAVEKSPGKKGVKQIRALVPYIHYFPDVTLKHAFAQAYKILLYLCSSHFSRQGLSRVLDEVYEGFVRPYQKNFQGGESTIPVLHAAYYMGIPFRHQGMGVYRLGWGNRAQLLDRSAVGSDFAIGARLSQNKLMAARLLRDAGLPASEHLSVNSLDGAFKAASTLGWPVVVKPLDRDRGEGVSVDVGDDQALRAAYQLAAAFSPRILIEKQVKGVCHRLFVAKGQKILFVSKRLPKSVIGDGQHSVRQLIDLANEAEQEKVPWQRLKPFPDDAQAVVNLANAGLTLDAIPAKGQYAPLRRIQSVADGGVVVDCADVIHPENVDIALRAAALFNLDSAGIDLITDDISKPWYENGAIINEVNFASLLGAKGRIGAVPKPHLTKFLDLIFQGNGRIPVEIFVGGEPALDAARSRHQLLVEDGARCYLTTHQATCRPCGTELPLPGQALFGRVQQLMTNRDVEVVIAVVQTDEFLHSGLPLNGNCQVVFVDSQLRDWQSGASPVSESRCRQVAELLALVANPRVRA
jgi:cyanophycin synthetase